jgi:hypothetical protein
MNRKTEMAYLLTLKLAEMQDEFMKMDILNILSPSDIGETCICFGLTKIATEIRNKDKFEKFARQLFEAYLAECLINLDKYFKEENSDG